MNIAFRVDVSTLTGSGHFMRCLTLADRFRLRGDTTRFVCRSIPEHFARMLVAGGHELAELPAASNPVIASDPDGGYAGWLGVTQEQDADDTVAALAGRSWDWLVVDHYAIDRRWETCLRKSASGILVIDDLADRDHDCDWLLDQNRIDGGNAYRNRVPAACGVLLGPRYALLREEFARQHQNALPRQGEVRRVFVCFGGVDASGYTLHAIQALAGMGAADLAVDVVTGAQNPHLEDIRVLCARYGYACHIQTDRMAGLMAAADLAIGAGGVNLWERCAAGLPALVVITAENQREQVDVAARLGVIYVPDQSADLAGMLASHLYALIRNRRLRHALSVQGIQTVDGRGAARVVAALSFRAVTFRRAAPQDCETLFAWRNHPDIRKYSHDPAPISPDVHRDWYAAVMRDTSRILLIGSCDGDDLGVVRFDLNAAHEAEISIYLTPARLQSQMGEPLLIGAERWLLENLPGVSRIRATVQAANAASNALFRRAGYHPESTTFFKDLDRISTRP